MALRVNFSISLKCGDDTMCGIAEASLALSAASGIMGAYGQYQEGQARQDQYNYQAAVQRNNAIRAEYLAEDAIERGKEAERQERLRGRLLLGRIRAAAASSGQVVDEGSVGELVIDQAGINELDALNVRNNAEREAANYRLRASDMTSEAGALQIAGSNAASQGRTGAATSLIGGAGKVASKWYDFDRSGW